MKSEESSAATLIVAWRTPRRVHGRVVRAGAQVVGELLTYANRSLATIRLGGGKAYDPDDDQDEAPYLSVDPEELLDTAVLEVLRTGSSLAAVSPDELRRRNLAFYALLVGDDPDHRSYFIRRGSPVRLADKGLVALFDDSLQRVTSPILAFNPAFDVIVQGDEIWALDQKAFEAVFKDTDVVLAKTGEWVDALAKQIPISTDSLTVLAERLRENSVLRRKVQSILRSEHFEKLTKPALRAKMKSRGMDPAVLMPNGELVFTRETERDILQLLNEDLFTGDFSGEQYAASRKSKRTQA